VPETTPPHVLPRHLNRTELLVAAAFILSGAAGLVYQVAWQRILALHSGVGIYSVAMIVASFMAGLGLGSLLGGRLTVRASPRAALRTFGVLELTIGAFGAASCWLYYDLLYLRGSWLYGTAWSAGALHFLGLLLPTGLMGMTLPFLVRAFVRDVPSAGRTIGLLYGLNLLGAAAGAVLTPWVLIRFAGIRGAVLAAAAANVASGGTALLLSFVRRGADTPEIAPAPRAAAQDTSRGLLLWALLYALSGFIALSLEMLWFRVLDVAVKASAFAFGTLLALYLLGLTIGCLTVAVKGIRFRQPLRAFLVCQCLLLVWSGLALVAIGFLPPETPGFDSLYDYWGRGLGLVLGQSAEPGLVARLYLAFPLLLFGVPTVLMGVSFPALQQAVHDDPRQSGRRVGMLQAANIAGCVAGSLLVGLLGLTLLGTTASLRALVVLGLVFAGVGARRFGPRLFAPLAAALVLVAVALPGQERFWSRLHGRAPGADVLVDEDATAIAALARRDEAWLVYVNGKEHSWIPFGGAHSTLGAVPALVHPDPRAVAVIGLGSGDTIWAAGCRPETTSLVVFEIAAPQPRLLKRLAAAQELPELRQLLSDPRLQVTIADGRNAIAHSADRFDVIEADALWPHVGYSGNLYSVEFFERCAQKLRPRGVMCTWAPTRRIYDTFVRVFPHVLATGDRSVLIGSREPLPFEPAEWRRRLDAPDVTAYLGHRVRKAAVKLLARLQPVLPAVRPAPESTLDRDLFPRDEFLTP
jgi:spermidine synthase